MHTGTDAYKKNLLHFSRATSSSEYIIATSQKHSEVVGFYSTSHPLDGMQVIS